MRQSWTKEKVRDAILGLHRKTGKANSNFVQVNHPILYQAALRHFGSWPKAVEAAGLEYSVVRVNKPFRRWSKKAIVAELKHRQREGLALNQRAVSQDDDSFYRAARRHFGLGGWDKALRMIGLSSRAVVPPRTWTKQQVLAKVHELCRAGVPLNCASLIKGDHRKLYCAGRKWFGSWRKTIEAAGYDYNKIQAVRANYWTPQIVIKEIKQLEKSGIRLSLKAIRETRNDLLSAAITRFGSWGQAVEAAGISYQAHCLKWSTKAFLRKLSAADVERLKGKAETLAKKRKVR